MRRRLLAVISLLAVLGFSLTWALAQEGRAEAPKGAQYKVVFVPAPPAAATGPGKMVTGTEGKNFARDMEKAIQDLARQGYRVVSVVEVTQGAYNYEGVQPKDSSQSASAMAYGFGFSYTAGVNIVGELSK
jgi:hypothetical protein